MFDGTRVRPSLCVCACHAWLNALPSGGVCAPPGLGALSGGVVCASWAGSGPAASAPRLFHPLHLLPALATAPVITLGPDAAASPALTPQGRSPRGAGLRPPTLAADVATGDLTAALNVNIYGVLARRRPLTLGWVRVPPTHRPALTCTRLRAPAPVFPPRARPTRWTEVHQLTGPGRTSRAVCSPGVVGLSGPVFLRLEAP